MQLTAASAFLLPPVWHTLQPPLAADRYRRKTHSAWCTASPPLVAWRRVIPFERQLERPLIGTFALHPAGDTSTASTGPAAVRLICPSMNGTR
jgi:hypothetical protein